MNNSISGKAMENLRKRMSVKLINNAKDYVRCISKRSFVSQKIFSKNFVAIHEIKPVLTLNKPIYVGFCILDLSKLLMNEFHYKHIKSKFDAKLLPECQGTPCSKQARNLKVNWIRTHNHLVHKRTLNHLAKLAK